MITLGGWTLKTPTAHPYPTPARLVGHSSLCLRQVPAPPQADSATQRQKLALAGPNEQRPCLD